MKISAVAVLRLTKEFNGLKAVDSIDLSIEKRELFGPREPNRAAICGYDVVSEKDTDRTATDSFFQDPIYIGTLKLKEGSYIT